MNSCGGSWWTSAAGRKSTPARTRVSTSSRVDGGGWFRIRLPESPFVIPGRREAANPESITAIVSMDSGLAPRGAPRNDEGERHTSAFPRHDLPEVLHLVGPLRSEGAGKAGRRLRPQSRVRRGSERKAHGLNYRYSQD